MRMPIRLAGLNSERKFARVFPWQNHKHQDEMFLLGTGNIVDENFTVPNSVGICRDSLRLRWIGDHD